MGQYFTIVNPTKRQYLDAIRFYENIKASGVLYGYHAIAVAFLVCNLDQVRDSWGNPILTGIELAGSWCGDQIFVVSDQNGRPDEFGIRTSSEENPNRTLSQMAKEEFEDISYKSMALICNAHEAFAEELARRAVSSYSPDRELVDLGNVVFCVGCESLRRSLENEFGNDWISRYKAACAEYPGPP